MVIGVTGDKTSGERISSRCCCASLDWDPGCDGPDLGWYGNDGVWSCTFEASRIEGTWLGRAGLGGALPRPDGGWYCCELSFISGLAVCDARGHWGAGVGRDIAAPIPCCPVRDAVMACGKGCLGRWGSPRTCGPWRIRGGESEVSPRRCLSACSLARFTEPPLRFDSLGPCMGKSISTDAGVMVYCRIYVEQLCIFVVGNSDAQSL